MPPPERHGSPSRRAIWPDAYSPNADSGPPNAGEPVFMSVAERNEPITQGAPGRTSCTSAIPASTSAVCCTSAAGTVTGAIAPISRNGVTITAWPASA